MSGDDRDRYDRPSWREIDQRRDSARGRGDDRPRGREAEERARAQSAQSLKAADELFSAGPGGEAGKALAQAVRDAHGTPELPAACRAYRDEIGLPRDTVLLSLFLDSADAELVVPALEALLALQREGRLEINGGLKSQLRVLEQDFDDAVAGAAEELLASA